MAEKEAAAEAEVSAERPREAAAEPKKPIMMIALSVVNMVVMGAVVFMLFQSHKAEKARPKLSDVVEGVHKEDAARSKEEEAYIGKLVPMETFLVNLAGTRGAKLAKINMELEVDGTKVEEELEKRKPQMRDVIIILLSSKTYDSITSKEGKDQLRNEVKDTVNSFLVKGKIKNVFFTDFIVN